MGSSASRPRWLCPGTRATAADTQQRGVGLLALPFIPFRSRMGVKMKFWGDRFSLSASVKTAARTGSPERAGKPSKVNLLFISRLGHGQYLLSEEPFEILNKQHDAWAQESRAGFWCRNGEIKLSFYLWTDIILNKGDGGYQSLCSFPGGRAIRNVGGEGSAGRTEIRTKKELAQALEPVTREI